MLDQLMNEHILVVERLEGLLKGYKEEKYLESYPPETVIKDLIYLVGVAVGREKISRYEGKLGFQKWLKKIVEVTEKEMRDEDKIDLCLLLSTEKKEETKRIEEKGW